MRPQKQLKQSAEEILPHLEEAGSSTKGQATAVGPPMAAPASPPRPEPDLATPPRLSVPDRQQLLLPMTIDELLEPDHPARAVWSYVQQLDLTLLYDRIRARGRSLADRLSIRVSSSACGCMPRCPASPALAK